MGQGADGYQVNAGVRHGADSFMIDAPRSFHNGLPIDDIHRLPHHVHGHVIQHDDVRAAFQRLPDLVYGFHLHLHFDGVRRLGQG